MTSPDDTTKPKLSRAGGKRPAGAGFDLSHATAPTNDPDAPPHEPAPAAAAGNSLTHAAQAATYLARSDNQGGATVPYEQQPAPAGAGGGGMVVSLSSLVTQIDPETDLVQFNTQLPRYYVAAIDIMIKASYGSGKKLGHARQAFGAYIPEAFLTEARRALYPHLPPRGQ